ncbi:MAG TPA: hypothetical protein VG820_12820 [Fimbriimonadaceae bacterium]|nr:hypothetical protein [Fimbriimonadaceae bacterium]
MKATVIAFFLGVALTVLLASITGFFLGRHFERFWEGQKLGIGIGIGVIAGVVILNFIVTNSDKFFNKKL